VLGAGDAFASGGRMQASYVLRSKSANVLIDAGPTLLAGLKRAAIKPGALDLILVTHLHGDHFAGLPFLFLEYLYESPAPRRLTIAGPRNLENRVWALFRLMFPKSPGERLARKIRFVTLKPATRSRFGAVSVECIRTPHTTTDVSLAFKLTTDGKSLVFSGDTGWTEDLVPFSANADLMLLECTYFETEAPFHLNYPRISANLDRFRARRLVLTHLGREALRHSDEIDLEIAYDGMTLAL
jgi:ribonuclease BN (tRNA processing enzyme)